MMSEVFLEKFVVVYWIENLTFIAINKISAANISHDYSQCTYYPY